MRRVATVSRACIRDTSGPGGRFSRRRLASTAAGAPVRQNRGRELPRTLFWPGQIGIVRDRSLRDRAASAMGLDGMAARGARRARSVEQLRMSVSLSLQRYRDGVSSYFEVLDAQQEFFPSQLELVRIQRDELVTMVGLYRVLGGGWKL